MHVAPVVAPAAALGDDRLVEDRLPFVPARDIRQRRERAGRGDHVPLHAIREIEPVLRVAHELPVQAARLVRGGAHAVDVRFEERALLVPRHVLEFPLGRIRRARPAADRVPVFDHVPVLVAVVKMEQRVVDELGDIEVALHRVVERVRRRRGLADHRAVHRAGAAAQVALVDDVVVVFRAAHLVRRKAVHGLLGKVVHAPVEPVDEEVEKAVVARESAHRAEGVLVPRIMEARAARALESAVGIGRVVAPVPP